MRGDRREIDQKFRDGCLICVMMFGGAKENANCRFGTRRRQARIYAADAAVLHSIFSPRKHRNSRQLEQSRCFMIDACNSIAGSFQRLHESRRLSLTKPENTR
ncbi:hypothetical protein I7I50_01858 [Histoplasma capsulatum G186AR]|uniref:Uncharacterized protein n=1 Tax=Ajellomyces capsulatus TaxID=5037 RepID=A0A8H7YF89_AJECA|nr:hypothetical protein I7I52_12072 [Histoplasma capsulatum]QSS71127.1 hypothetical protein I7I50_01858 [Histoplasma capsulatum G186AR]